MAGLESFSSRVKRGMLGRRLRWIMSEADTWLDFMSADLSDLTNEIGVYVIWTASEDFTRCIRVGQGVLKDRIYAHRQDRAIAGYAHHDLRVTFALVAPMLLDGVEAFLADKLYPLVGERFPDVYQIPVNLPGT